MHAVELDSTIDIYKKQTEVNKYQKPKKSQTSCQIINKDLTVTLKSSEVTRGDSATHLFFRLHFIGKYSL